MQTEIQDCLGLSPEGGGCAGENVYGCVVWRLHSAENKRRLSCWRQKNLEKDWETLAAAGGKHIPAPPGSPGKEPVFPARCRFGPWTSSRWGSRWTAGKPTTRFGGVLTRREPLVVCRHQCVLYLIGEGLRWVVDDDGLGEIPAQDVQVFDVIPLDADAVLAEQPVPEGHSPTIRSWHLTSPSQVLA